MTKSSIDTAGSSAADVPVPAGPESGPGVATTPRDARMALVIFFIVAVFSHVDRRIVIILQEPIKLDLGLSDTQLGFLTGLSFAIVYSTVGLPIARYSDRNVRKRVIALGLAFWSALTAMSGMTATYTQLILLRMGVAVGEAGAAPASQSMISDYFPPEQRVGAFTIWSQAVPIGLLLSFAIGGTLQALIGWRATLVVVGLAGLIIVPLILSLKEPVRGQFDPCRPGADEAFVGFSNVLSTLLKIRALRYLMMGTAFQSFVSNIMQAWSPSLYVRAFRLDLSEAAAYLTIVVGVGGAAGVLLGGYIAKILSKRDKRWLMWVPAFAVTGAIPLLSIQLLTTDLWLSLASGFCGMLVINMYLACMVATAQSLSPPTMRTTTSAIIAFITGMCGLGLGPLTAGAISDMLITEFGMLDDSLRYALLICLSAAAISGLLFFRSAHHLRKDLPDFAPS